MKLTEEFPMSVQPVRPGVYQIRKRCPGIYWSRWTGSQWNLAVNDFNIAAESELKSYDCYATAVCGWRGLAENPEGGAA